MVNKQWVCSPQNWLQQALFLLIRQRSDIHVLIRNYPDINDNVSFLESCNANDSAKDVRLTTARALSSLRPSVLGRVF